MSDTFSQEKRSSIMRTVKSKGNLSTEQLLITIFKQHRITGWRRNYSVIGKPDFVLLDKKIAIFADGCFWHGHNCRNITPKQNAEYWEKKLERNMQRDRKITLRFEKRGWKVFRFWECDISTCFIDLTPLAQYYNRSDAQHTSLKAY